MTDTTVTVTVRIRLTVRDGHAETPHPTQEHGGLSPVPAGCCVLLDVGDAHRITQRTARTLAGALRAAHHIDVIGTHAPTIKGIRAAIARALEGTR
ncbi:hypothetical protein ACOQFV_27430 [Nocardiopsis changdeensis]|uniref:STAS domain-containing protein n=1 Tax=Nocardiopsis changdeensis TaxID=2831969 RepID=A0ABX8BQ99_9ACTN|nr:MULTISPECIES: hypothetical protein [Nocardiopsis]QUX23001.1 hypothetical protein KGD84_00890 [Nocardiopsis changdeensis]QYX38944.1 hypothetical protein K1J57_10340 [Nocardiopsis sp. MT53]